MQESFLRAEFSEEPPKFFSTNFNRSSCITEEKVLTNSQTLNDEKNFLLHVSDKYAEQA